MADIEARIAHHLKMITFNMAWERFGRVELEIAKILEIDPGNVEALCERASLDLRRLRWRDASNTYDELISSFHAGGRQRPEGETEEAWCQRWAIIQNNSMHVRVRLAQERMQDNEAAVPVSYQTDRTQNA